MAGRNVSDKVNLKYCIPKLIFTKKVDRIQYFNVYFKLFDSDPAAYITRPWNTYATNVGVNPDGTFVYNASLFNIVKNGKFYINNLSDYKEYCIKFVNVANSNFEAVFKFKTGSALTLKDSPYYGRVLFPEQNYDIHIAGTDEYELPTPASVWWYYPLDSHKYEKRFYDDELYASFIPALIEEDADHNKEYNISENAAFDSLEVTDPITNETILCYALDTKTTNSVLLCPFLRYNNGNWEPHDYYDGADGSGGIALCDMSYRKPLLLVYIDSNSSEPLRCIYHWDNRLLTSLGTPHDNTTYYCYVYVDTAGHLVCKYWDTSGQQEVTLTSTTVLPLDRFFILDIFNNRYKEWIVSTSGQTETVDVPITTFSHNFKVALAQKVNNSYSLISDWMTVDDNCSSQVLSVENINTSDLSNFTLAIAYKADVPGSTTMYMDFYTGELLDRLSIVSSVQSNDGENGKELKVLARGEVTYNENHDIVTGSFVITPSHGTQTVTRPIDDSDLSTWENIDIDISQSYDTRLAPAGPNAYDGKIPTPFAFGGPGAEKIYVAKVTAVKDGSADSNLERKMIKPSLFNAIIQLDFHIADTTTITHTITNPTSKPDSIGFIVPVYADLYGLEIESITMKVVAAGVIKYTDTLSGLTIGENVIPPYTFPEDYIYDSFDVDFNSLETLSEKVEVLKEMFFTKHGTWGGYNGGVNGHNCYINKDGVLTLENHGDKYSGTVKAVGKEGIETLNNYTGYGGDLYTEYTWDNRTNKQCLRVGTTLVSNKYFTFGKTDIWMKLPKGIFGVCPAIWFFHYIEVPEGDPRYNSYPYNERVIQGTADDGYYRVVNNEIDIELPSHLTKGNADNFEDLVYCYFDPIAIDDKTMIGIGDHAQNEDLFNTGLFRLTDIEHPNDRESWEQVPGYAGWYPLNYEPSFQNCKFNNWQGEYNSGDGWAHPQTYEDPDTHTTETVSAEDYYKGTDNDGDNPLVNEKEEYLAIFQHLTNDPNGVADGRFHKWTIEWLPDRTVLYVDDVCVRVNKGFVPFNVMKLTIGTWFPTMPLVKTVDDGHGNIRYKRCNTQDYKDADGVLDQNGIYGVKGALIDPVSNVTPIGTWAGVPADWEVCQVEISRVKYVRYNRNDVIETYDNNAQGARVADTVIVEADPTYFGESYPESGLRWFDTQ